MWRTLLSTRVGCNSHSAAPGRKEGTKKERGREVVSKGRRKGGRDRGREDGKKGIMGRRVRREGEGREGGKKGVNGEG